MMDGLKERDIHTRIMAIPNAVHMVNMVNTGMITNGILTAV